MASKWLRGWMEPQRTGHQAERRLSGAGFGTVCCRPALAAQTPQKGPQLRKLYVSGAM